MRKVRENILPLSNKYALATAGDPLFVERPGNKPPRLNLKHKQLGFYDPRTNKFVGPGTTPADVPLLGVALGVDTNGDGAANTFRASFGKFIHGCNVNAITAEPSRCGTPEILDTKYKCVECNEDYHAVVTWENDRTMNEYPFNRSASVTIPIRTTCCDCENCEDNVECRNVAEQIVDFFKGGNPSGTAFGPYNHRVVLDDTYPFDVVILEENSVDFCLDTAEGTCGDCVLDVGLRGIKIDDNDEILFVDNVDPDDATKTLSAQIPGIIDQIEQALADTEEVRGTATIIEPNGTCCASRLQINSNVTPIVLVDLEGEDIAPCATTTPLAEGECGLRFIAKLPKLNCGQYVADPVIGFMGNNIDVFLKGFNCGSVTKETIQEGVLPEGTGYYWQWVDYASDKGNIGRDFDPWNDNYGFTGIPLDRNRLGSVLVDCNESYCPVSLEHNIPNTGNGVSSPRRDARGRTVFLTPESNAALQLEVTNFLNAYTAGGAYSMCALSPVSCVTDEDQTEDPRFNDHNGRIQ